jgi:hypothetical protein
MRARGERGAFESVVKRALQWEGCERSLSEYFVFMIMVKE